MSQYQQLIRERLALMGRVGGGSPRLIEGWMRLQFGCLDGLDRQTFDDEIEIALACIAADPQGSERLADSYGL